MSPCSKRFELFFEIKTQHENNIRVVLIICLIICPFSVLGGNIIFKIVGKIFVKIMYSCSHDARYHFSLIHLKYGKTFDKLYFRNVLSFMFVHCRMLHFLFSAPFPNIHIVQSAAIFLGSLILDSLLMAYHTLFLMLMVIVTGTFSKQRPNIVVIVADDLVGFNF